LKFTHLFALCFKEHFGKVYSELKLSLITDYPVYFGLGYKYNAVLSPKLRIYALILAETRMI
jgi:hypothetical protein